MLTASVTGLTVSTHPDTMARPFFAQLAAEALADVLQPSSSRSRYSFFLAVPSLEGR